MEEKNDVLLSDVIVGTKDYKLLDTDPIVFKIVSMALFDAVIGNSIYKKAQSPQLGTQVEM